MCAFSAFNSQTFLVIRKIARSSRRFGREDGSITVLGVFLTTTFLIVAGLAVDVMSAMSMRTKLQVAADSAAHAALVSREYKSESEAKAIGMSIVYASLSKEKHGEIIKEEDIKFGMWDSAARVFTISPGSDKAVLVDTQRIAARANPLGTFFFRFLGLNGLDIVTQSVFESYYPGCFREGLVAQNRVDVQSNNTYGEGFCIHSNDHVAVNNGNTFLSNSVVSMPDSRNLVTPSDGMDGNPGLEGALRDSAYNLRILQRIQDIIDGVDDPKSSYFREDYVDWNGWDETTINKVTLDRKNKIDNTHWVPGAIHRVDCNAPNQKVSIPANEIIKRGVLITNCQVSFGANSELHDAIIVTTNEALDSFSAASGFTLGRNDGCSAGGGAQLVTLGGMNFPSDLQVYGGQMIAAKAINFAARADGMEGVSIVSGDQIDGTSLINMGFCGGAGLENNFMAVYFRMAE